MAHFAQMVSGSVHAVIVVANSDCDNLDFPASEPVGQAYIASLGLEGEWLQTSYSGSFRGRYAGIGFLFENDEFVAPPPIES